MQNSFQSKAHFLVQKLKETQKELKNKELAAHKTLADFESFDYMEPQPLMLSDPMQS